MMIHFSIYSLAVSCLLSTILIIVFWISLNWKKAFHIIDIRVLNVLFIVILIRLIFPFNIGVFQINTKSEFFFKTSNVLEFTFWNIFQIVWLLGACLSLTFYFIKIRNNQKISNYIFSDPNKMILKDFQFPVLVSEYVSNPMVLGMKKIILLPDINYSDQERFMIIAHEIQHIKNKDVYIKCLISLICAVYWWFIPLYFFKRCSEIFLELRVDEKLITEENSLSKYLYLESLITVAKKNTQSVIDINYFSSSLLTELETRVYYLLSSNKHKYSVYLAGIIFAFSLAPSIFEFVPDQFNMYQPKKTIEQVEFNGLDSTDKVLQISNGGWLHGEADISSGFLFNFQTEHFNSSTDPSAISVKELESQD